MPSSPESDLFDRSFPPGQRPKRPRKTIRSSDGSQLARGKSRRTRIVAWTLTLALMALSTGIWLSPPVRRLRNPSPDREEIELATEQARGDDLKHQIDELSERLRRPHPGVNDDADRARADDLARQVDELEARLRARHPTSTNRTEQARADDLSRRLKEIQTKLTAPRPPATDGVQRARAEDLARRLKELSEQASRPRPAPGRFDGVTADLTKADVVAARRLFGLYTTQAPFDMSEVGLVEDTVARKANLVGYFQDWTDPFRADAIQAAWQRHQIPLLTWEPAPSTGRDQPDDPAFSLPTIIAGAHDDYIRSYARGIHDLGMPVVIRLAHEMNGDWYPWSEVQWKDLNHDGNFTDDEQVSINGNRRGDYARMWRHVHDIFDQEGANNLTVWLWAPNRVDNLTNDTIRQPRPAEYYPGDDVVDWIGMSGYLRPTDTTPTFDSTYGATLEQLRSSSAAKPIVLAEIGATEITNSKVAWINSLFNGLARNPDVAGFVWFSLTVSALKGDGVQTNDWRINSTRASSDAMAAGLGVSGYGLPAG